MNPARYRSLLTAAWLGAALVVVLAMTGVPATASSGTNALAPRPTVSGNQLMDAVTGAPLRVAGVNRSGSEYARAGVGDLRWSCDR